MNDPFTKDEERAFQLMTIAFEIIGFPEPQRQPLTAYVLQASRIARGVA